MVDVPPPMHVTSIPGWITATATALGVVLGGGGFAAVIIAWIKRLNPRRELDIGAEERMREELNARLKISEERRDADRLDFQSQIRSLQEEREADRVRYENEIRLLRHRANNSDHAVDMLLALLEANPNKVAEAIEKVRLIRIEQAKQVAMEKGQVMAAREIGIAS